MDTLSEFGIQPMVHDPLANPSHIETGNYDWVEPDNMPALDLIILAVPHTEYLGGQIAHLLNESGAIIDIRSALDRNEIPETVKYWSL